MCPLERGVIAVGRKSGVLCADIIGLPPFRSGVDVRESTLSRELPFCAFTAENDAGAGVCAWGVEEGWALTAVNPPELTAVKPDDATGRVGSAGAAGVASPWSVALRATDALTAGESEELATGVPWADFFKGDGAGEGVNGPPCSNSSI